MQQSREPKKERQRNTTAEQSLLCLALFSCKLLCPALFSRKLLCLGVDFTQASLPGHCLHASFSAWALFSSKLIVKITKAFAGQSGRQERRSSTHSKKGRAALTYMTSRIQNRPMFLKLLTSMRWVRTKAWYTGFACHENGMVAMSEAQVFVIAGRGPWETKFPLTLLKSSA
eukprot:1091052-Pelagomonas_calceolata.AAC.3